MKITIKDIVYNATTAALYVALTLATYPLSFEGIQFRFSEIMVLLCFFRKDYIVGLTLGCLIVNLMSPIGIVDVVFGGAATLIACLGICFCKHLCVACIIPVVANGFIVGFELYQFMQAPFWLSVLTVSLGELAVMVIGYIFVLCLKKNTKFWEFLRRNQNENFVF